MSIVESYRYPWFGIQVHLRKERVAAAHLDFKGYDVYLPMYRRRTRWSDRMIEADCPLFPGYLFCRFESTKPRIVATPGVVAILGCGGRPEQVPDNQIEAIRTMLHCGLPVAPHRYLTEGEAITITKGPLKGVSGLLARNRNELKVVVSVELLQRSVAVEVDRDAIEGCFRSPFYPTLERRNTAAACTP